MKKSTVRNIAITSVAVSAIAGMTIAFVKKYRRIKKELEFEEYEEEFEPETEVKDGITYHKLKTYYKKQK